MKASAVEPDSASLVEAARYALLRRLAPAFRHRMVGSLHPIELIAEAAELRLQAAVPDPASAGENLRRIKSLSHSAVATCTNLITWLAPEEDALTLLGAGIDECLGLLGTDFGMRGFAVRNETRETGVDVSSAALRYVLTAALIAATDNLHGPADLVLTAAVSRQNAVLSILINASDRAVGLAAAETYRRLEWSDVGTLARAESVDLSRQGQRISMRFAIAGTP